MGISDGSSYRGARLFEAVGLDRNLCRDLLAGTPSAIGGARLERFEREALERLEASRETRPQLENPGYVKFRKGGEPHATDPDVVDALQAAVSGAHALRTAVRDGRSDLYDRFASLVNDRAPLEPRDLLELVPADVAVPLDEVEPAESIVRRFSGGAMSHGALSAEAHETIAVALNGLGGRSNSGEGGEDSSRFRDERNSKIKQVASGRFGVTAEYAVFAEELQIKIAQGSKPGEGGQIPAHKVSEEIARLRRARPGVSLISPPPHHDIYSIEDLAQLIFDLREVNPHADVSVKLVAETGVGIVAAGVAKAHADVVHVGGADGGTGASPLPSIKHAGVPWEVGLAEVQQALVANHLRGRVRLRVDGGFKTGRDVVVAALLGADEYSFGTALLLAEGCLMVRSCHLDTCPVGIATQQPELRAKFAGTPEMVRAYLLFVAEEARRLLAALGLRSLDEAVGRVERLRQRHAGDPAADTLDLSALLTRGGEGAARYTGEAPRRTGDRLGILLQAQGAAALDEAALVEPRHQITNGDRAVGARLGGAIARRFGSSAPLGRIRARFEGSGGQSFGAFLTAGVELRLVGEANDYVGKAMSGGRIVIAPPPGDAGEPCLIGNTALYGATGGQLYCAGSAGERFAVRNSGAVAVVEGVGDHACEYMTAGTVVVLGEVGLNFGAGMTGGEAYVHDPGDTLAIGLNDELVVAQAADAETLADLRLLVERHARHAGSSRAERLLESWSAESSRFVRIAPRSELAELASDVDDVSEGAA
jgi:glutamate synthase (ferredoxin)